MKKNIVIICLNTALIYSCEKKYDCVCKSKVNNTDVIMQSVKTTKLGSKGFKRTCLEYEQASTKWEGCYLR